MAAQEYRISSELQRCCWYVVLSTPALAAVLVWVGRFVQGRGAGGMDPRLVLWAALACAAASAFNWRLRLDECGIARRRLFRWDLWTWDDLASGRIPKMHAYVLADPARPWWRRRLNLGCMAADDIQTVLAAINARYRLPPPPDLPDRLAITWGFRQRAVLDHNGLELLVRGAPKAYSWDEVRRVYITRMDPLRRDFKALQIELADQEIDWRLDGSAPRWRGATAEEINEFLQRHIVPERIDIYIAGQPLRNRERIQRKLRETEKIERSSKIMMAIFLPFLIGCLAWMAVDGRLIGAAAMGGMVLVSLGPIWISSYRSLQKQDAELKEALKAIEDGEHQQHS